MTTVVTGLGVISPCGIGPASLMRGLENGRLARRSSIADGWPQSIGTPIPCMRVSDAHVAGVLQGESHAFLNPESSLLLAAARLALADARYPSNAMDRTGIVVSTRHAGLQDYAELYWTALGKRANSSPAAISTHGAHRPEVSPIRGPQTGLNAPAAHLSIRLGARGPNMTLTNGAVGGIDALTYAADALESGRATTMLVGAVEKIPRVALAVPPPGTDCRWSAVPRPFDRCRTGSLLGEAGVVAVLERAGGARHRGAEARARLSATASAFSPDNSLEDASRRSLNWALNACSLIPEDVGAVFAGANGSLGGDAAESRALYAIFGDRMPVCAVKGATADSMGAAALVQLAVALISMRRSLIPGTAGFRSLGDDIAPIKVVSTPEPQRRTPVVIHAWDAGSCSASAVLDKYDARTSPHPSPRRPDAA